VPGKSKTVPEAKIGLVKEINAANGPVAAYARLADPFKQLVRKLNPQVGEA
jgi:hypothetical protein